MEIKREHHINFWYILGAMIAVMLIQDFLVQQTLTKTIPYSEFEQLVDQGQVSDLVVGQNTITGTLKDAKAERTAAFLDLSRSTRTGRQADQGETRLFRGASAWLAGHRARLDPAIGWFPAALDVHDPADDRSGRGRADGYRQEQGKVLCRNGHQDNVRRCCRGRRGQAGAAGSRRLPEGSHRPQPARVRACPRACCWSVHREPARPCWRAPSPERPGVPFFSISGSEFVEMFVGVGAARVRDLFEQARQERSGHRVHRRTRRARPRAGQLHAGGGGHDEKEQTLNQLLNELDGFDPSIGVVLLAATNRPEILDPALLRAGRFDRQVLVDRPDKQGPRRDPSRPSEKDPACAAGFGRVRSPRLRPGFSGADLANLVNEAALLATRRNGDDVTLEDFTQAIERIVAGLEKRNRILSPHERDIVAHHEMGHALVAMSLPGVDPVQKVSIIPRGIAALGYTMQRPLEDRFLMDRAELINRMTVLFGGRAAESLIYHDVSTGAGDDLAKATEIARSMVVRFGMDKEVGQVAYEHETAPLLEVPGSGDWQPRHYGEATAGAIDAAVRALTDESVRACRCYPDCQSGLA